MPRRFAQILLFLGFVAAATLHAQGVHWDPARGNLAVGQAAELQLVFEGCTPDPEVRLPKIDGLSLEPIGRTVSTSIINFNRSDSVTITYTALLSKKQSVTIPSFEINTNKGKVRTTAVTYEAVDPTVGSTGVPLDTVATGRLVTAPSSVWAGEVLNLQYTIEASHNNMPDFGRGVFEWNAEPLVTEEWSRPEPVNSRTGADARDGLIYRTRAIARNPGAIRLNAVHQLINLAVGVTGFGFFQQRQYQQFSVPSSAPLLEVKPLPPAPAGFTGAVGALKLESKVVPLTGGVGEPITWTLRLSGTANWPDVSGLPAREVSKDFQIVSPQAKRTPVEGKLFEGTLAEDVVLVPTKPGTYTLGPLTFAYFDPKSGAYKTITTPATTVTITPPTDVPNPATPVNPATVAEQSAAQNSKAIPPPPPLGLPRDPLPGTDVVTPPMSAAQLGLLVLSPFASLLLFWLFLALQRARVTDPFRARRAAHARLTTLLMQIRQGEVQPSVLRAKLLEWQHDTAFLLHIAHAAPTPAVLNAKLAPPNPKIAALWSESDRALYGENTPLPADWPERAAGILADTAVPRFAPLGLFLPRNLFPFFALILCAVICTPRLLAEASAPPQNLKPIAGMKAPEVVIDPALAYRRGDFAGAEKAWRTTLASAPTDAIARHNLSLALAQQDRWDEAAAHAAAAFVQLPSSEPIRAQFALTADRSGHVPVPLAGFLNRGPLESIAALTSTTGWQYTLVASAALVALALAWLLHRSYANQPVAWPPFALLGLSFVMALIAILAWHGYGETDAPRAAIVWRAGTLRSIPTEVDTTQKTSPVAAGVVGVADQNFLGWQHLKFEAGQAGWVRTDEVVPIWK
jgi:hypothetical protein